MSDEELALKWQKNRDMLALSQLRVSNKRLVKSQVSKFRRSPVPMPVIESKADELLVKAADTFQAGKGASFKTHLFNHLRRLDRFVKARANIAYLPETTANKITVFENAKKELADKKGRPATAEELADHLHWPIKEVKRQQKSVRLDIASSAIAGSHAADLTGAKHKQLLHDIVYELTPDEKKVFAHIMGMGTAKKTDSGREIAALTGFSQAKVSNLRRSIAAKLEPHL